MQRFGLYAEDDDIKIRTARMIKEIFYNAIALPLIDTGYTRESLPNQVRSSIKGFLAKLLNNSKHTQGIHISEHIKITQLICPDIYHPLLAKFEAAKVNINILEELIDDIMRLESFEAINPVEKLCEMQGWITATQIRESFYNLMYDAVETAVTTDVLTRDDVELMESEVFTRLPALTLFDTLLRSVQANADGILLIDNRTPVNLQNCPLTENFPALINAMITTKNTLAALTPAQQNIVKLQVTTGKDLTREQASLKNEACQAVITAINGMAVTISQRAVFKKWITDLLNLYLGMQAPEAHDASKDLSPKLIKY